MSSILSNVSDRRGGKNPLNDGLASGVILEVQSQLQDENSDTGVSSLYVPVENHQWFVLRATYNRVEKEIETLRKNVAFVYLPKHYIIKQVNGKKKRVSEPLVPNLVFVYSTQEHLEQLFCEEKVLSHYHFYRDKTKNITNEKHPPLVVPHEEMLNFIRLTSVDSEHIKLVEPEHCHYKSGDKVRIVDGDFAGVVGRVARISGQQRVIVTLTNIGLVSTAYIPTAFMQIIE